MDAAGVALVLIGPGSVDQVCAYESSSSNLLMHKFLCFFR